MQSDLIYRHVFVVASVLHTIRREVRRAPFTETGGPLVGYISADDALVVTHASGPGPRAEHARHSVLIDGQHAQQFCDHLWHESDGRLDYVGDWHRHPGWSLTPSQHDIVAMCTVAAFEHCPIPHPISLIYRRWPPALRVYVLNNERDLELAPWSLLSEIPT